MQLPTIWRRQYLRALCDYGKRKHSVFKGRKKHRIYFLRGGSHKVRKNDQRGFCQDQRRSEKVVKYSGIYVFSFKEKGAFCGDNRIEGQERTA